MKTLKHIFLCGALFAAFGAFAAIDNPVTQAVIGVYDEQLSQNPKDYNILFRRGSEYFNHGVYDRALSDVDAALQYVPGSDKDMRTNLYLLRASIYNSTGRPEQALTDLNSAVALDPDSYRALYERANTEFSLGNYGAARTDYTRMQRLNPRSVDALIGFARCAIVENNFAAANDYLQQAVDLDANNPEVYLRRSSLRTLMGNHNGAVDDLIVALSLKPDDAVIIGRIVDYSNTNYPATMASLANAIKVAPQNGLFRYLRASIAESHYNYLTAIEDLEYILNNNLQQYHGLYASLARSLYALGRYDEALNQIDNALGAVDNTQYFVLRSKILRALGRNEDAVRAASHALTLSPDNEEALIEQAINKINGKEYQEASNLLGEASMNNANNPETYILRAWIQQNFLNQPAAAKGFNEQALTVENYGEDNVKSLRGFALLNLGKTAEANRWMEDIIATVPDNDGLINYYGACFYSLQGLDDKALECVERSLMAGYSDNHNWMDNADGQINVAPLRDDLRFLQLLQRYNSIFGK